MGSQISNALIDYAVPAAKGLSNIKDFIPPIVLMMINLITPPIFKRLLIKILKGRSV
jgi:hypothetical protein